MAGFVSRPLTEVVSPTAPGSSRSRWAMATTDWNV
jgi:hypothetical protein